MKFEKEIQKRIFDLEKNFKSYCLRVNIDSVKNDIKTLGESISDSNLSFNNDMKTVMENLSKIISIQLYKHRPFGFNSKNVYRFS